MFRNLLINIVNSRSGSYHDSTDHHYYIPLNNNSILPKVGNISAIKSDLTFDSYGVALFNTIPNGIVYKLASDDMVYATAFDFKVNSNFSSSTATCLINVGSFPDGGNAMYIFLTNSLEFIIMKNTGSSVVDYYTGITINADTYYRICYAHINNKVVMYLNGIKVNIGDVTCRESYYQKGYFIVGNAWRYRVNDGDRTFGGNIKNLDIWTKQISESKMSEYSTLE